MTSRDQMTTWIADQCKALGSLDEALRAVRCAFPQLIQGHGDVLDVFPRHPEAEMEGKLCRCRGMIQEVRADVNLFCTNGADFFSENAQACDTESEYLDAVDLYVVPVPGNSHFYETLCANEAQTEAANCAAAPGLPGTAQPSVPQAARKRQWRDDAHIDGSEKRPRVGDTAEANADVQVPSVPAAGAQWQAGNLNLPHPPTRPDLRTACIVTVISPRAGDAREAFRTNDIFDFYGYLHSSTDADGTEGGLEGDEEELQQFSAWGATELSTGLVSRLLCLSYAPVAQLSPVPRPTSTFFRDARDYALHYLSSELCGGDELLAQFLLLHLCSRVTAHNPVTPVGDIPLLICSPSLSARTLSRGIAAIAPVAEVLLTAHHLRATTQPLIPKHDNQKNYLRTGTLQVANGSHVTIDCTGLDAGEPWSDALFTAIHKQHLVLEYPYQTVELPINVAFLAVCASVDTVCTPFDFGLRVVCSTAPQAANAEETQEAAFSLSSDPVRNYLMCVQAVEPSFEDLNQLHQRVSDTLVALSSEQPNWNNRDPLVHNNSFSIAAALLRALATSHGRSDIEELDLTALVDLERQRIARTHH